MRKHMILFATLTGLALFAVLIISIEGATPPRAAPVCAADVHSTATTGWNSGWFTLTQGTSRVLNHNLGGEVSDYAVELWFRDTEVGGLGVHTFGYGGFEESGQWEGGYWSNLTDSTITVHREANDATADAMRVRVWFMTTPDYDSDWQQLDAGDALTLTHALGGTSEDYTLSLWEQDTTDGYGIHNRYLGSVEHDGQYEGAHWQNLNDQKIRVVRWADDTTTNEIRVRMIAAPPDPAYDSDWQEIAPGEILTLTHNVGGQAGLYRVRLQYRDASGLPNNFGQHILWAGGEAVGSNAFGGHWQRLTNNTIELYRQPGGSRTTEVRLRIWQPEWTVFLPLVIR